MKVIEILKLNKGMLKTCRKVGIRMEDVQYIELYNDYNRLLDEGEKVSYIVAVLAERYNVCERKVYTLIKRCIWSFRRKRSRKNNLDENAVYLTKAYERNHIL